MKMRYARYRLIFLQIKLINFLYEMFYTRTEEQDISEIAYLFRTR